MTKTMGQDIVSTLLDKPSTRSAGEELWDLTKQESSLSRVEIENRVRSIQAQLQAVMDRLPEDDQYRGFLRLSIYAIGQIAAMAKKE